MSDLKNEDTRFLKIGGKISLTSILAVVLWLYFMVEGSMPVWSLVLVVLYRSEMFPLDLDKVFSNINKKNPPPINNIIHGLVCDCTFCLNKDKEDRTVLTIDMVEIVSLEQKRQILNNFEEGVEYKLTPENCKNIDQYRINCIRYYIENT
jgi:hypothetical protein